MLSTTQDIPKNIPKHQRLQSKEQDFIENEQNSWAHWAKLTSIGFLAGAVGQYSIYAADTVKTRLQASGNATALQCAKEIFKRQGVIGFYRGVTSVSLLTSPEKAVKLGLNDFFRSELEQPGEQLTLAQEMLSGGVAGMGQVVITCPMEICKIRMQLENKSPARVLKDIGIRGLYRGSLACWTRDIPFSMMYFPAYHMSKAYFKSNSEDGELTNTQMLITGLGSGTVAAALVTPMDVIKTRIQGNDPRWRELGVFKSFKEVYNKEGHSSLWRGLSTRLFTRGPQFAITVGAYEFLQKHILGFVQSDQ